MAVISRFRLYIIVIYLISFSNSVVANINTNMEMSLFEKIVERDVKYAPVFEVTTASSLFECLVRCTNSAGCGLLNYNVLTKSDNCEMILSGQSNITLLTSQQGWNAFHENAASVDCTSDWIPVGSSCYKLETDKLSWDDAQARCELNTNGHLVDISSEEENQLLENIFKLQSPNQAHEYMWIGLSDQGVEGNFTWSDGTALGSVGYENWSRNQPDDGGGKEDCGTLFADYAWNDASCYAQIWSICEIDIA